MIVKFSLVGSNEIVARPVNQLVLAYCFDAKRRRLFLPSQVTNKYNQPSMDLNNKVAGLTVAIGAALG